MKRYRLAALGLGVLVLLLLLLTLFGFRGLPGDTVVVELGFEASSSTRAQAFDEALVNALERGHFGAELRRRMDHPARSAHLDGFHADRCEVRQIDFERFARWHERSGAESAPGALFSSSSGHRIAGLLQSPASGVNYVGAATYCAAAGGRLPWAGEWEALAVGRGGRLYPWGDTFNDDAWPYQDAHRNASQPCGAHPAAATPEGVHDLAGNAMEWSRGRREAAQPQPGAHGAPAVRATGRAIYALSAAWLPIDPETRSHHLGFRCVYAQPPAIRHCRGVPRRNRWRCRPANIPSVCRRICGLRGSRCCCPRPATVKRGLWSGRVRRGASKWRVVRSAATTIARSSAIRWCSSACSPTNTNHAGRTTRRATGRGNSMSRSCR